MLSLRSLIFFVLALLFVLQTVVFAQEPPLPKCVGCHKTPAKILPKSHQDYKMEDTALCASCHKTAGSAQPLGKRVHTVHLKKSPELMKNCLSCHQSNQQGEIRFSGHPAMNTTKDRMSKLPPFFTSWGNSTFLDNSHGRRGAYCLDCHSDYVDEYTADDTQAGCVKCHGDYQEMIKKTAKTKFSHNPHQSHYVDLKCSVCHHGHRGFEDHCGKCHGFGYKMPVK